MFIGYAAFAEPFGSAKLAAEASGTTIRNRKQPRVARWPAAKNHRSIIGKSKAQSQSKRRSNRPANSLRSVAGGRRITVTTIRIRKKHRHNTGEMSSEPTSQGLNNRPATSLRSVAGGRRKSVSPLCDPTTPLVARWPAAKNHRNNTGEIQRPQTANDAVKKSPTQPKTKNQIDARNT